VARPERSPFSLIQTQKQEAVMAYTYDDLKRLIYTGDPLADPKHPEQVSLTDEGLVIRASNGVKARRMDLRITIQEDRLVASVRDPDGAEPAVGAEWSHTTAFQEYDDLVSWFYVWFFIW
jgi:hypothetical protein